MLEEEEFDKLLEHVPALYQLLRERTATPNEGIALMILITAFIMNNLDYSLTEQLAIVELFATLLHIPTVRKSESMN